MICKVLEMGTIKLNLQFQYKIFSSIISMLTKLLTKGGSYMKKYILLILFLSITTIFIIAKPIGKNMVQLTVDTVSFEDGSKLKVYDDKKETILLFSRFENKNIQIVKINNTKIYNVDDELIMTIVVNFKQSIVELHTLNNQKERGLIRLTSGMFFSTDEKVDYYGKPFELDYQTSSFGTVTVKKKLYYKDKLVMLSTTKTSPGGVKDSGIFVDKAFLKNNKIEAGIWAIIYMMLSELGK